ncbi:MAG: NAD/NADP octopine/nopaline dehydrogenase family protein [Promethearchaeota archaeon]
MPPNSNSYTILGAGNGGRAFAVYLARKGFDVHLGYRTATNIKIIKHTKQISSEGAISGSFSLTSVTHNYKQAVKASRTILFVVPASIHRSMIQKITPSLVDGQIIILNPGRTWGAIEVYNYIQRHRPGLNVYVCETQTLLFTCRKMQDYGVSISKIKNEVNYCFFPELPPRNILTSIQEIFPNFKLQKDIRITSLNNIGAVLHPLTTLLNAGSISRQQPFLFYREGVTPQFAQILQKVDQERCSIIQRMGLRPTTFLEWAKKVYGIKARTYYGMLQKIDSYKAIRAPPSLNVRYFTEDIPTGLVPLSSLGKFFNIKTPVIDSLIIMADALLGTDYRKTGRTITNCGVPHDLLLRSVSRRKSRRLLQRNSLTQKEVSLESEPWSPPVSQFE